MTPTHATSSRTPMALLAVLCLVFGTMAAAQQLATIDESLTQRRSLYPFRGSIPVIYAYGKPYERGVQIGRQIRALDPHILSQVAQIRWTLMMKEIPGITRENSTELRDEYIRRVSAELGAGIVTEYIDEMRGVGDGAGVSFDEMFMLNLGGHYRKFYIDEKKHPTPYYLEGDGCSSFSAWGKATTDGRMIATHNCDWPRSPDRSMMVAVVLAPENGNRVVWADTIGLWGSHHIASDKVFVAGLALGTPKAKPRNLVPEGPNGMLQRWIVQYANSAQHAHDMLMSKGGAGDRGVATPSGSLVYVDEKEAIYLQTAPDRIERIPNKDGWNAVTNHILVDAMKPHFTNPDRGVSGSANRLAAITKLLQDSYGKIDIPTAVSIMSTHYDPSTGRDNPFNPTPCSHGEFRGQASGTNLSTIVKLEEDTVWLALGNPCTGTYTKVRIGSREEIEAAAKKVLAGLPTSTNSSAARH